MMKKNRCRRSAVSILALAWLLGSCSGDEGGTSGTAASVEVTGANHTHFANVCAIGNLLIDQLMITQDRWATFGAEALIQPYNDACTDEVFPIAEAHRLQNLYMVAHFKRYLLGQTGYDQFLSSSYAAANEPAITFVAK